MVLTINRNNKDRRRAVPSVSGFTLIELIVVVGIIGVLVSISLPALRQFRENARDATDLAHLRTHSLVIAMYAGDWKDYHPSPLRPSLEPQPFSHPVLGQRNVGYFWTKNMWHWPLLDTYFTQMRGAPFNGPRMDWGYMTHYQFSASLMAHPAFWNLGTRTGPQQWGATKASNVRFPSQKAYVVDWSALAGQSMTGTILAGNGVRLGFADGSAAQVRLSDCTKPVAGGEGNYFPASQSYVGWIGMHTKNGINGRDVTTR